MTLVEITANPNAAPKRRVLVVDDDLDTVRSMIMLLRMMGHDVQFAINGFAALDVARAFKPDLIFLAINPPDFTGPQIAKQLRYERGLESTRIIAVSGNSDDVTKRRAA